MDDLTRHDVRTDRGVDYADGFLILDADDGPPVDLTGYAATAHARRGSPDAPGPVALAVPCAVDGPAGTADRTLTAAQTLALPAGDYWYELVLEGPGRPRLKPAWGHWTHRPTGVADGGA